MIQLTMTILYTVLSSALLTAVSVKMFQMYQLGGYKVKGVVNWFRITRGDYLIRYFGAGFFSLIGMLVFYMCFKSYSYWYYIGYIFFLGFSILFIALNRREVNKTPVKYTPRMVRFVTVAAVLYAAETFFLIWLGGIIGVSYTLIALLLMLVPFSVTLAHWLVKPFETLNNYGYKVRATKYLKEMPELIRVGITGSFGKTTEKAILKCMLETKYTVCASKASYNTPLGLARTVNNDLTDDTQVLIAEMGARNVGDIAELAKIVVPNYGLITGIGNQHLETFGSRENIKRTKYELIENLAVSGLAVFNADSPDNVEMFTKTREPRMLTGAADTDAEFTYDHVRVSSEGTEFDITVNGETTHFTTKLLGKHIAGLTTMALAVAFSLGVTPQEAAEAVKTLQPVPHRLELIEENGMIIIDDAYNSNPEGAANALGVLKEIDRYKVIVTPGMVELGQEEAACNRALGEKIGAVCDTAILVGARGAQIKEGAIAAGMHENAVILVDTLQEAVACLRTLPADLAVLFENDLPDNY